MFTKILFVGLLIVISAVVFLLAYTPSQTEREALGRLAYDINTHGRGPAFSVAGWLWDVTIADGLALLCVVAGAGLMAIGFVGAKLQKT